MAVLGSSVSCSPVANLEWTQDVFGNLIATATFADLTEELVIVSESDVVQSASAWPVFQTDPSVHSFPFQYSPDEATDLGALRIAEHPDPRGEVGGWARAFVRGEPTDTLSLLKDLNAGVLGAITYRLRDEEGTQAPGETLALGSGSCRDIAALFIDAVRNLGFGARAVSGYMFDPQALADDPGSTHAWAEVYLPGAGWIAFDPTHRRVGGNSLIPIAVARSNRQIMPVIGGYLGDPDDFAGMDVIVEIRAGSV